jgi:hypothetical protein
MFEWAIQQGDVTQGEAILVEPILSTRIAEEKNHA